MIAEFKHTNRSDYQMKQAKSPLPRARDCDYTLAEEREFPYTTLNDAAEDLGIGPARLSRFLRVLSVPVHRVGYVILLDDTAISRVRTALKKGEVKRGRKKEGETTNG